MSGFGGLAIFRGPALIFSFSVVLRSILNFIFHLRWGQNAVNHPELWLYLGVLRRTHSTSFAQNDPTSVILQFFGDIIPYSMHFSFLEFFSVVLTSFTAVLIFFLAKKYSNEQVALYSAFIYCGLLETLNLSVSGFTHDHLLLPIMLASAYLMLNIFNKKLSLYQNFFSVAFALILIYIGAHINMGIFVGVFAVILAIILSITERYKKIGVYIKLSVLLCVIVFGICVLPSLLDSILSNLPQGRFGSADIMPSTINSILLKYNLSLLLLPFGVYHSYRKKNYVSLTFLVLGFLIFLQMTRGTRIANIGFAISIGYALYELKNYSFFKNKASQKILSLILVFNILLSISQIISVSHPISTQAEYELFSGTDFKKNDKTLLTWDRGYMFEVLSKSGSVSTPGLIDYDAHRLLWHTESSAAEKLKSMGITHVILRDDYFDVVNFNGIQNYLITEGLFFKPKITPPAKIANYVAGYKLNNGKTNPNYFKLIDVKGDNLRGISYRLYEVTAKPNQKKPVTLLFTNVDNFTHYFRANLHIETVKNSNLRFDANGNLIQSKKNILESLKFEYNRIFFGVLIFICLVSTGALSHVFLIKMNRKILLISILALFLSLSALNFVYVDSNISKTASSLPVEKKLIETDIRLEPFDVTEHTIWLDDEREILNIFYSSDASSKIGYSGNVTFLNKCGQNEEVQIGVFDNTEIKSKGVPKLIDSFKATIPDSLDEEFMVEINFSVPYISNQYAVGVKNPGCVIVRDINAGLTGYELTHIFF